MRAVSLLVFLMGAPPVSPGGTSPSLLDQAEQAYFAGDLDPAARLLDQVDVEEARSPDPSPERPRALLLRAALELKRGRQPAAETAARQALSIDPDLSAEAYPPSVRKLVDAVRLGLPARVLVRLKGVPEGTQVWIDGRALPAESVLAVLPGSHHLTTRNKGKGGESRQIDARSDLTVDLGGTHLTLLQTAWRDRRAGPALLGASGLCLAGSFLAAYDLHLTQQHQSGALTGDQHAYYNPYITQYQVEIAAGLAFAATAGVLGANRMRHGPHVTPKVSLAPTGDGAAVLVSGTF